MKQEQLNKLKAVKIGVSITLMIIFTGFLLFTIDFYRELDDSIEKMGDIIKCEIEYKEFKFKGICSYTDEVTDFLNAQYNTTK